ncbi:HD domain-containing protein [Pseudobacteroides cellulosolvens]|uniref:HD domain-containing protein n=1 Tax=Pseudobacteroides cellulosolvens TaxID=35825 RepID=UPI0006900D40|nr:HD domain-containing protein [Pseudobacteroides cellulosolvens]
MVNKVRDSVHGFIYFTDIEKEVINWPEFQRLRYIKQLALTNYVYPGAVHTRFEHSLGVMEMSSRMFDRLCIKTRSGEMIEKSLKVIGLDKKTARQVLRLASLLHDVGHLPFSHGGEAIIPKGKKHEDISISIIEYLQEKLEKLYFKDITNLVVQLIQKQVVLPELKLLKDIISGNIDADRMDYLLRDSHHCGVDYGYFDHKRLIESLSVIEGINGGLDLAIKHDGIHALEALILARYYMFTQVYCHRTRRIYDNYLKGYMESWKGKISDNFIDVTKYDDVDLIADFRRVAEEESNPFHNFAYRIYNRKHHSMIYETSEFTDARDRRKSEGIYKQLSNIYSKDYNLLIDHGEGNIHKFLVDGEDEAGEEFYVIRNDRECLLTEESHIIKKMPKKFHVVRIYIDSNIISEKISKEAIDELRIKALEVEREVR